MKITIVYSVSGILYKNPKKGVNKERGKFHNVLNDNENVKKESK